MASSQTVNAGDLIIAYAGNSGSQAINDINDGAGHSLTLLTGGSNVALRGRLGYSLASVGSGSLTFSVTFAGSCANRFIGVWVFTPSAACTHDQDGLGGSGNSTAPASAAITTTGADELCFGACYSGAAGFSAPKIGGVAATNSDSDGPGEIWYKAGTLSAGTASITAGSGRWLCDITSFFISGGGGGTPLFMTGLDLSGNAVGGPFFGNPLARKQEQWREQTRKQKFVRRDRIFIPEHMAKGELIERAA